MSGSAVALSVADGMVEQGESVELEISAGAGVGVSLSVERTAGVAVEEYGRVEAALSAETDETGRATVEYRPPYRGTYAVEAALGDASATATFEVGPASRAGPPAVLSVTDAVGPGDLVAVSGEGFTGADAAVAVAEPEGTATPPDTPPGDARELPVVGVGSGGHRVVARLPRDVEGGTYDLWVRNADGWSEPAPLNAPRPLWLSESSAAPGLDLLVVGRNLDGREFGADERIAVRLEGEAVHEATVTDAGPFAVRFEVPEGVPPGEYDVAVTNDDGTTWRHPEEDRPLTVVEPVPDPLGLGVAWAREFAWGREYDAAAFGALGDGDADDTAAIQAAIDDASDAGGVVTLPPGEYRVDRLVVRDGVVLRGAGRAETTLVHDPREDDEAVPVLGAEADYDGRVGVADLTLTVARDATPPECFLRFGTGAIETIDRRERDARHVFVTDIAVDYPYEAGGGGVAITADAHVLVQRSRFRGHAFTGYTERVTEINEYAQFRDNDFDTAVGNLDVHATRGVFVGNRVKRHPRWEVGRTQGVFTRGPCYVAGNTVESTGTEGHNDGEPIAVENWRGGAKLLGSVLAADADSVTVAPERGDEDEEYPHGFDTDVRCWGEWTVVIVGGRGLGQYREIAGREGNTYTVAEPWDVVPDGTSEFVVVLPNWGVTFCDNVARDCNNHFQFYNDVIDGVMANNVAVEAEGFWINTYNIEWEDGDFDFTVGYRTRMEGNHVVGGSPSDDLSEVFLRGDAENVEEPAGYTVYDGTIRDNTVTRYAPPDDSPERYYNGINVLGGRGQKRQTVTGVVVEGNHLRNLDSGVTVRECGDPTDLDGDGEGGLDVVLSDNTFVDVAEEMQVLDG